MAISLLDESLLVRVFFEEPDCDFRDNVRLSILEDCPVDEKVFIHDETNLFLTPDQADLFAQVLIEAATQSRQAVKEKCGE